MKKVLHILVPLLLGLLVLFSIGWYFLKYDPSLTRDLLLEQARYQNEVGNYGAAVWFYDLAYLQSDKSDEVALELAQQYLSIGNYTKAERTLSKAIADGADEALYIALCSTYVEQNKLLDAVTMLDNIADPDMKARLDALRPAAPVPDNTPGTYSQYIQLGFTSDGGSCYISSDGSYPSIKRHAYSRPFQLVTGEQVFYGITVSEQGLVSKLGTYSYIVGGVIEPVVFADPAFETALREQLKVDTDTILYSNDLWTVTELNIPAEVSDYQDLKWLPNLQQLTANDSTCTDFSIICQLSQLRELTVTGCPLTSSDLANIAALPQLQALNLRGCQLSSIAALSGATELTSLELGDNMILDISVIADMIQLKKLDLERNALVSLDALRNLGGLQYLDVSDNSLSTISALSELVNLTWLDVSSNDLMNLSGAEKLTQLVELNASHNNLTSIDELKNAAAMVKLNVSNNTLLNIDPVAAMPVLDTLNFAYNEVTALPSFTEESVLYNMDAQHNLLSDLTPLRVLYNLCYLQLDYNEDIRSVDCLQTCHLLSTISLFGTGVTDVQVLKDMSVQVYYNPVA